MRDISTKNLRISTFVKPQSNHPFFLTFFLVLAALFLCESSFAQTFPPATSCTSKDLELISATLPAPSTNPCQCDGTRPLILGIRNKTGSTRTAFALWGTLKRYNSAGTLIESKPIFACANTIKSNQDNLLPASSGTTQITVSCGESLEIVDLYLAWTSANNNENCDYLIKNAATINPKCGTLPKINIGLGVTANFSVTSAFCKQDGTATGSIKVYPSGGKAPYKVKIGGDERVNISAKDSTTFTLAPGDYDILITDSSGCSKTFPRTIDSPDAVNINNIDGAFTKNCTLNKNGKIIGETSINGYSYSWSPSAGLTSSTVGNPFANPATTTTYYLTKTNNTTGCSAQTSVTVTVDETAPSISAGSPFTINCKDNKNGATIGEDAQTGYSYSWSPATGLDDDKKAKPWANPSATNIYSLTKTNNSNGCTAQANVKVTVDNDPVSVSGIGGTFTKTCTQNKNGAIIGESPADGYMYSWSPATGLSDALIGNPNANPSATTTYTVTKTNTTTGCSNTASVTVTVDNAAVDVSGISGAFTKTCIANTTGNAIGETAQDGYTYSWSSSPEGFSSSSANPTVNPTATTTYTVRKTKTSSGCFADATVIATVNNMPVTVSAGSAFTISCTQNVGGATIGESAEAGHNYSWSPTTSLSSATAANPLATPSATTTYTVTKTNNTSGCSKQASVTVTVDNTPISVSAGNSFTKTCTQNANGATIGETPVSGYSYSWSPTTGLSNASIGNPTANPSATTTYTVRKTNTTSGCFNTATVTVIVNNAAVSVNAGTAFIKTCTSNINGATIGEVAETGFGYSWLPATGLSSTTASNPTANPSVTTTYTVTKTNTTTGCSQQASVTVTVNNTVPTFTVCLVQPTLCANSGSVTFNATGGSGFEYSIDNGATYKPGNSFTGLSSGDVTGFLVRNSFGCVSTGVNCNTTSQCQPTPLVLEDESTAQEQTDLSQKSLNVKAYPNPFNNRVRFEVNAKEAGSGSLEVFNTLGQKVKTIYRGYLNAGIQTFELNIPANKQSTLIYILKLGDKQVTGKLFQSGN